MHWEVRGVDAWNAQLQARFEALTRATAGAVDRGAGIVQNDAQALLSQYTHPRGTWTPSPPGYPPALISGGLRRSIRAERVQQTGPGVFQARIGPKIIYGRIQEVGGTIVPVRAKALSWLDADGDRVFAHSVTLPPRPYMRPAVDGAREEILDYFVWAWNRALHTDA
jgi:hypothetical protein